MNLDLAKLKSYNIPMQQVLTALGQGNANAGGSYLEQGDQQYLIRGIGLLRSPDDIGNIIRGRAWRNAAADARSGDASTSAPCRARAPSGWTTTTKSSPASSSCARARIRRRC